MKKVFSLLLAFLLGGVALAVNSSNFFLNAPCRTDALHRHLMGYGDVNGHKVVYLKMACNSNYTKRLDYANLCVPAENVDAFIAFLRFCAKDAFSHSVYKDYAMPVDTLLNHLPNHLYLSRLKSTEYVINQYDPDFSMGSHSEDKKDAEFLNLKRQRYANYNVNEQGWVMLNRLYMQADNNFRKANPNRENPCWSVSWSWVESQKAFVLSFSHSSLSTVEAAVSVSISSLTDVDTLVANINAIQSSKGYKKYVP